MNRPHELTVVKGTLKCFDTAVTPPSLLMISKAVIAPCYDMRKELSTVFTNCVVARRYDSVHQAIVLTKKELLTELAAQVDAGKIKYARIGEALGLPSSRVSEIFNAIRDTDGTQRELSYDEGVKLIRAFGLERSPKGPQPIPTATLRLVARHAALQLQAEASEDQIAELAEDLRAFSEYVANPKVRQRIELAEGFLEALHIRRPTPEEEARQETDHGSGHA